MTKSASLVKWSTASLNFELPTSCPGNPRTGLLLFAHFGDQNTELGPAFGIQLWAEGSAVIELNFGGDDTGEWRASVLLEDHD
jgi:hypothetical protein